MKNKSLPPQANAEIEAAMFLLPIGGISQFTLKELEMQKKMEHDKEAKGNQHNANGNA